MTDASSAAPTGTLVTVYPMTGRQLFFSVPHAICEGGPGLRKLLRDDRRRNPCEGGGRASDRDS